MLVLVEGRSLARSVGRRSVGDIGVELDCTHGGCRDSELDAAIASGRSGGWKRPATTSSAANGGRPLTQRRPPVTISIVAITTRRHHRHPGNSFVLGTAFEGVWSSSPPSSHEKRK